MQVKISTSVAGLRWAEEGSTVVKMMDEVGSDQRRGLIKRQYRRLILGVTECGHPCASKEAVENDIRTGALSWCKRYWKNDPKMGG